MYVIARNEMIWQLHSDVIASEAWQSHKKECFINILKRLPHSLWSLAMTIYPRDCFFVSLIAVMPKK
jgi:hypothetical protein